MDDALAFAHAAVSRVKALGIGRLAVGFSMGKDSLVLVDLLRRAGLDLWFYRLDYGGLEFMAARQRQYERLWGVEVHVYPHPDYIDSLRRGVLRPWTSQAAGIASAGHQEMVALVRQDSGCAWVATGERLDDSYERRLRYRDTDGVDLEHQRLRPLLHFGKRDVLSYLTQRRIPVNRDYERLGHSFEATRPGDAAWLADTYPDDFAKLCGLFPHLPAVVIHHAKQQA